MSGYLPLPGWCKLGLWEQLYDEDRREKPKRGVAEENIKEDREGRIEDAAIGIIRTISPVFLSKIYSYHVIVFQWKWDRVTLIIITFQ